MIIIEVMMEVIDDIPTLPLELYVLYSAILLDDISILFLYSDAIPDNVYIPNLIILIFNKTILFYYINILTKDEHLF
jgi:hypothetical protein